MLLNSNFRMITVLISESLLDGRPLKSNIFVVYDNEQNNINTCTATKATDMEYSGKKKRYLHLLYYLALIDCITVYYIKLYYVTCIMLYSVQVVSTSLGTGKPHRTRLSGYI